MTGSTAAMVAMLLVWLPAQPKHVSRMAVEVRQDACAGLTPAECCAQRVELAGFRATGEHVSKATKVAVRLSCAVPSQVVPEGACRTIALGRGLPAQDVSAVCEGATLGKRCEASDACRSCVVELEKLKFTEPARACLAVTYTASAAPGPDTVILLRDDKKPSSDGSTLEIRRRRTVLR
jgi:hypothetical protein